MLETRRAGRSVRRTGLESTDACGMCVNGVEWGVLNWGRNDLSSFVDREGARRTNN